MGGGQHLVIVQGKAQQHRATTDFAIVVHFRGHLGGRRRDDLEVLKAMRASNESAVHLGIGTLARRNVHG